MKEHALKISSAAIALIKKHQGLSLEKYRDEKGLWVIGYGRYPRSGAFSRPCHTSGG